MQTSPPLCTCPDISQVDMMYFEANVAESGVQTSTRFAVAAGGGGVGFAWSGRKAGRQVGR